MNPTEIHALTSLLDGQKSIRGLAEQISLSYTRTTKVVNSLTEKGFATRSRGTVNLSNTLHAVLFRRLAKRYDLVKLLGGRGEDVAIALLSEGDVNGLQEKTGLAYRTIRRALVRILETGAVRQVKGRVQLVDDRDLHIFLESLKEMRDKLRVEPYAEVISASREAVLKRVPRGRPAKGFKTAFSSFSDYGVEVRPLYDYYVQQERKPTLEEVLAHALAASTGPVELTDCAVLFAKTLDRLSMGEARRAASKLDVESLFLDLENYIRNLTVSLPERFLPWEEFAEKALLYGVDAKRFLPREAFPGLFSLIGEHLRAPIEVYLFGGEAMRIKGLKRATKDVDIAVKNESSFAILLDSVSKLSYRPMGEEEVPPADKRLNPSGIFVKEGYPRIDAFTQSKPVVGRLPKAETIEWTANCLTDSRPQGGDDVLPRARLSHKVLRFQIEVLIIPWCYGRLHSMNKLFKRE